jgi:outer membrane beta-barrel protein
MSHHRTKPVGICMNEQQRTVTMYTSKKAQGDERGRTGEVGRRLLSLAVVLAVVFSAGLASAQEGDDDVPGGPLGDQLEDYWSVDRDVDVVKNKLYSRKGRFAAGLYLGVMSSEPFHWYNPAGLRASYYFSDNWGLEVEGAFTGAEGIFRHESELTRELGPGGALETGTFDSDRDTLDQFNWRSHAMVVWHPFYGKLALLQRKLAHFDINLAAGFGAAGLTRPTTNTDGDTPHSARTGTEEKIVPEFVFGGGVQFFLSKNWVLRLSGRGYVYSGPMNLKNTSNGDRYVAWSNSKCSGGDCPGGVEDGENYIRAGDGAQVVRETNFFEKLQIPSEFLLGISYMF